MTAPLFVDPATGLNDDLNGVERPVTFDVPALGGKRRGGAFAGEVEAHGSRLSMISMWATGLITDMNAIRRDEEMDNLHSIYVDQWDWEKVITREERTIEYLKQTVQKIVDAVCGTLDELNMAVPRAGARAAVPGNGVCHRAGAGGPMARAHTKGKGKCFCKARTARCSSCGIGGALRSRQASRRPRAGL